MTIRRGPVAGALALAGLREHDITWRLLRADNADVIAALLGTHLGGETRRMTAEDLAESVDADLDDLRAAGRVLLGTGRAYLTEWRTAGYLIRRPSDDARGETLELSPEALTAVRMLGDLVTPRTSVTESRLASIAAQVRRLAVEADPDIARRLAALRQDRDDLDHRIARLERGEVDHVDPSRISEGVRDVLQQARDLPADFARVRARFEALNRDLRERIVQAEEGDRHVLDEVFRGVDVIASSDEGRSFDAFTALVLDPAIGAALEEDIDLLLAHAEAGALSSADRRYLARFLSTLKDQGREIQEVVTAFARGLRRYVQTREFQRERALRRAVQEALAVGIDAAKATKPWKDTEVELPSTSLTLRSAGALALHSPGDVDASAPVVEHVPQAVDLVALRAIARETEIDWEELRLAVDMALGELGRASVADVVARTPATQGIASVAGLVALAVEAGVSAPGVERVEWRGLDAVERHAVIPRLIFTAVPA